MSSKRTTSPASRDSVSCTIAIERIRRSDSSIAACASGDCSRRPCSRSSAAMVCRLFFTRWWISRMVASFDSSSRSRRRRSVTSRSSTQHADDLRRSTAAGSPARSSDVSPRSISSVTGSRARMATSTASWSKPISREVQARRVRVDAEAVHRADRVGAGEAHPQVGVEQDHAVADAGRVLELVVVLAEREACPRRSSPRSGRTIDEVVAARARRAGGPRVVRVSRVTTAIDRRRVSAPGCTARARARVDPSSGDVALDDLAGAQRARRRAGAPPRRRPHPRGPSGRRSGRWSAAPGRAPPSGCRPPPRPARAGGGRRSRGRRAPATTPRAAARDAATHPRARSWCAPARRTWSRGRSYRRTGARHRTVRRGTRRCAPGQRRRSMSASKVGHAHDDLGSGRREPASSVRSSASRRATTS